MPPSLRWRFCVRLLCFGNMRLHRFIRYLTFFFYFYRYSPLHLYIYFNWIFYSYRLQYIWSFSIFIFLKLYFYNDRVYVFTFILVYIIIIIIIVNFYCLWKKIMSLIILLHKFILVLYIFQVGWRGIEFSIDIDSNLFSWIYFCRCFCCCWLSWFINFCCCWCRSDWYCCFGSNFASSLNKFSYAVKSEKDWLDIKLSFIFPLTISPCLTLVIFGDFELLVQSSNQSLLVSKLESGRIVIDRVSGYFQRHGCLLLSLGAYHFGPGLSGRLGLCGHGTLHLHRQAYVLQLNSLHLDSQVSVALSSSSCIRFETSFLSWKISCRVRVPRILRTVVAAKRRVEYCAFFTLVTATTGLNVRK